jgi:sugar phosphate isomerase/epimerase
MKPQAPHRASRREFLRAGGIAATAAAITAGCKVDRPVPQPKPTLLPKPAEPPKPYGRYRVGVQSYCFRNFKFEEAIAKTAELGLHYTEATPGHLLPNSPADRLAAVQALLAARQVKLFAYGVCGFGKDEGAARTIFDFCKKVGIGVISAGPAPDSLDLLDKLVAEYDIQIAIHNHGPGDKVWGKLQQVLDGTRDHHPHIGLCLDTGHLARSGDDPVEAVRKLGPRLHALHIKDWNEAKHDCVVGKGKLDLVAFFTALKEVGFSGPAALEYELDADNPVPGIAASLEALRAVIAQVG